MSVNFSQNPPKKRNASTGDKVTVEANQFNLPLINRLTDLVIQQIDGKAEEIIMDIRNKILDYCRKIKNEIYKEHRNFIINQKVQLEQDSERYKKYFRSSQRYISIMEKFHKKISNLPEWYQQEPELGTEIEVKCQHCQASFVTLSQLNKHIGQLDSGNWTCRFCCRTFFNEKNLDAHSELKHNKIYNCEICNQGFKTPLDAWVHHQIQHTDNKYYKDLRCKYCKKLSTHVKYLRVHVISTHNNEVLNEYTIAGRQKYEAEIIDN